MNLMTSVLILSIMVFIPQIIIIHLTEKTGAFHSSGIKIWSERFCVGYLTVWLIIFSAHPLYNLQTTYALIATLVFIPAIYLILLKALQRY